MCGQIQLSSTILKRHWKKTLVRCLGSTCSEKPFSAPSSSCSRWICVSFFISGEMKSKTFHLCWPVVTAKAKLCDLRQFHVSSQEVLPSHMTQTMLVKWELWHKLLKVWKGRNENEHRQVWGHGSSHSELRSGLHHPSLQSRTRSGPTGGIKQFQGRVQVWGVSGAELKS